MAKRPSPASGSAAGHDRGTEHVRIPVWLPAVVYAVVTLILFRDFIFSDAMLFGSDTEGLGYMARAFFAEQLAEGTFPHWNPLLLGGTPFLDSLAGGDSLYPLSVLLLVLLETHRALGWKLVLHVFLAGLFAYGWTRSLGRSRAAAFLAGLAYLVAPFMVSLVWPGQDGKIFVTALTPLLFWAVESWFARGRLGALAGVAATVALVLLTTHFQMAYFLFGAVGAYAIFRSVQLARMPAPTRGRDPRVRAAAGFGAFLAASLVGAAAASVQLLPAVDYVTEHSRRTATTTAASPEANRAYASSWSLHPEEIVAILAVPEFVGSNVGGAEWTTGTYWGRNPGKYNHEYLGLVALVLAGLAFAGGALRGLRWFMVGMGTIALLYGLGAHTPVWGLFYALVPGIKLFRAPGLSIFLSGLAAVTLLSFGVDRLLAWTAAAREGRSAAEVRVQGERGQKVVWIVAAVLGVGMLLAASGALLSFWTGVVYTGLEGGSVDALARARPFIARGFLAATVLVVALGATLLLGRRGALKPSGVVALLALLLAFDALRVDAPFITTRDFDTFAATDPNAEFLLERQREEPPFRVLDLARAGQEVRLGMFGLELAGGHHPNDLARYRELIGMVGSNAPQNLILSPNVARMLNVRYLAWPARDFGELEGQGIPLAAGADAVSATQLAGGQVYEVIYELPTLPRARLVAEAEVVPDERAVETLMDAGFDVARRVVLAEPPPLELGGGEVVGQVTWLERGTNVQRLQVQSDRAALLVIADNWYPAWQATVSGDEAPVLRANHTLRAVPVPAGEHEVVLRYGNTPAMRAGLVLTATGWLLIAAAAGASWFARRPRRDRLQEHAA